jgi:hypothetical protein
VHEAIAQDRVSTKLSYPAYGVCLGVHDLVEAAANLVNVLKKWRAIRAVAHR